jgi:hypothetical protein
MYVSIYTLYPKTLYLQAFNYFIVKALKLCTFSGWSHRHLVIEITDMIEICRLENPDSPNKRWSKHHLRFLSCKVAIA